MHLLLLALAVLVPSVRATSESTTVTVCDAWANFGCANWTDGNRLKCIDPAAGPMPWTHSPVRSSEFTVRAGDGLPKLDDVVYTPDKLQSIFIRSLEYGWKFRGLLLHAVDEAGSTVGSWEFPPDDQALFWTPPGCPNTAMHVSAEVKPYRVQVRFRGPPKGTGTITFRCLLKRGEANHGWFHLPKDDLVLEERSSVFADKWFEAEDGQTCSQLCSSKGGVDQTAMGLAGDDFLMSIDHAHLCALPVVGSCNDDMPRVSNSRCYHRASDCGPSWRSTEPLEGISKALCACNQGGKPRLSAAGKGGPSALLAPLSAIVTMLAVFAFGENKSSSRSTTTLSLCVVLCLVLAQIPGAKAHNWLHTPGRASFQASTIAPCQGRKTSDLHAQVGPGQEIVLKWATGHSRDTYWVVLHGDNARMLAASNFEKMIEEYIEDGLAAGETNHATTPGLKRYHGTNTDSLDDYNDAGHDLGALFERKLNISDSDWLDHPRQRTKHMYEYKDQLLIDNDDVRLSYESTKPHLQWIESAMRYNHLYHTPSDYDSIKLDIPGRSGLGHHIIHWRWSGYYDCVDVDRRAAVVPADIIYGTISPGHVYNRVDHCQYREPQRVDAPCMQVTDSVLPCIRRLPGWKTNNRLGVQVVPLKNPATVFKNFEDNVEIPWSNGVCSGTTWLQLPGEVTEKATDWGKFWSRTVRSEGTKCTDRAHGGWMDLKRAVARCMHYQGCKGVTVKVSGGHFKETMILDYDMCMSTTVSSTEDDVEWMVAMQDESKTNRRLFNLVGEDPIIVNFAPKKDEAGAAPAGALVDVGEPYQAQQGNVFGWSCDKTVECTWCCREGCDASERSCCQTNAAYDKSYTYSVHYHCPNGKSKFWDLQVENGIYSIDSYHTDTNVNTDDVDVSGCNIEGVRLQQAWDGTPAQPHKVVGTHVEVLDGSITLNGDAGESWGCRYLNYLSITKVGLPGSWGESWLPHMDSPHWQLHRSTTGPVGNVRIVNLQYYEPMYRDNGVPSCPAWWLFRGGVCVEGRPMGWFNGTEEGLSVYVSHTPCFADGCRNAYKCGDLRLAKSWDTTHYIHCNGAVGAFVTAIAHGRDRILAVGITAYAAEPPVPAEEEDDVLVCYGVEARQSTATKPEFEITNDPEDPAFYSTCFVREANITWLDIAEQAKEPSRWRWHGRCLDCASYQYNQDTTDPLMVPRPWVLAEECMDCDVEWMLPAKPNKWVEIANARCRRGGEELEDCPADYACEKQLDMPGRDRDTSKSECQMLAEKDPECSDHVDYSSYSYGIYCRCWKKHACCGNCNPREESNGVVMVEDHPTKPAGSSCAGGIKSVEAGVNFCCTKDCVNKDGEPTCATSGCAWNSATGGSCCTGGVTASCSDSAAPCWL